MGEGIRPIAADRRGEALMLVPIDATMGWKVFSGMSLCGAEEPVAMALCATAVTDGMTVVF